MVRRRGFPMPGELVICKVKRINPNSVFVDVDEYGKEGMIHISEISSSWVRDIRNHVKKGQSLTAKVINVDEKKGHITLSLKRVDKRQENEKKKEHKMSQRAEKMLELVASQMKKSLNQAYEEAGYVLQESFGSLYEGFNAAVRNPKQLEERGVPKEWIEPIKDIAEKNIEQKEFVFSGYLEVNTFKPGGINIIKGILKRAQEKGLEVSYIAAPKYLVKYRSKNAKKGEREFQEKIESLEGEAEISFRRI